MNNPKAGDIVIVSKNLSIGSMPLPEEMKALADTVQVIEEVREDEHRGTICKLHDDDHVWLASWLTLFDPDTEISKILVELAAEVMPKGFDAKAFVDACMPEFKKARLNGSKPDHMAIMKAFMPTEAICNADPSGLRAGDLVLVHSLPDYAPADMLALMGTAHVIEEMCPNVRNEESDIVIKLVGDGNGWYPKYLAKV